MTQLALYRGDEAKEFLNEKKQFAPTSYEDNKRRLLAKYTHNEEKVQFIFDVEICESEARSKRDFSIMLDGFVEEDENGEILGYKGLSFEIKNKANFYAYKKFSRFGISAKEFEQEFLLETMRLLMTPQAEEKEYFTFYERLMNAIPRRALDLVRKTTGGGKKDARNKQRRREYEAAQIELIKETSIQQGNHLTPIRSTMEERSEASILVGEIMESDCLTDEEKRLLSAMKDNPEASLRELAEVCNFTNPMKVQRLQKKINVKLAAFNPFNN